MKILLLDIETAPNLAYVWGLWKETVNIERIVASGYVLCWAAKWLDDDAIHFCSLQRHTPERMLFKIWRLLDEADVVVHYNGKSFDIPTLNKEFVLYQLGIPAPYKQVDLLEVVRKAFRFPSNKLDYVLKALNLGSKVRHPGFEMWVGCMQKDREMWRKMEEYNKRDVTELQKLYTRILPWIQSHPSHGAFEDIACCPKCGSEKFQQRGYAVTAVMKYRRYQCSDCGGWFRGNKSMSHNIKERMQNVAV